MNANHNCIRTVEFDNIKIGGENSFPIFNPVYVLNISIFNPDDIFGIVKSYYNTENRFEIIDNAQHSGCDILSLKFNICEVSEIPSAIELLKSLSGKIFKPLMISGCGKSDIDKLLLPELIKNTDREVIVNYADEMSYQEIVPEIVKGNHILVLKSPIDINLAKELNILSSDLGLSLDKILIDTDIGGLGYGLEYGYSIMEKIKIEGLKGDKYLNMPMISDASSESLKTKEARTNLDEKSWGELNDRAKYFELTAGSAVMACGANVIIINYPPNISVMKGLVI